MANTIVNLTLLKVIGELEYLLTIYPVQDYKEISNDPELQQKLLAYVLSRMPNRYITVDEENIPSLLSNSISCSSLEQLKIEELIKQGIYQLLNSTNHRDFLHSHKNIMSMYSPRI